MDNLPIPIFSRTANMNRFLQLLTFFSISVGAVFSPPAQAADPRPPLEISGLAARVAEEDSNKADHAKPDDSAASTEKRQGWGNQSIENCMAMWDSGTHMTKSEWRRTCEGVGKERAPYLQKK
jgi:hypothetical protein